MHLEPVEIQHVKLRRRPLGYDRNAVDRLLEDVTASYEDVWYERAKLDAELASLRNQLDGQAKAKEALEGSVRVAQDTADELLAGARIRAQTMVEDAHQQALATVRDARAEHERLHTAVRKLEIAETEITLRLRGLLTAARELLDGHENIRDLAAAGSEAGSQQTAPNGASAQDVPVQAATPDAGQSTDSEPVEQTIVVASTQNASTAEPLVGVASAAEGPSTGSTTAAAQSPTPSPAPVVPAPPAGAALPAPTPATPPEPAQVAAETSASATAPIDSAGPASSPAVVTPAATVTPPVVAARSVPVASVPAAASSDAPGVTNAPREEPVPPVLAAASPSSQTPTKRPQPDPAVVKRAGI